MDGATVVTLPRGYVDPSRSVLAIGAVAVGQGVGRTAPRPHAATVLLRLRFPEGGRRSRWVEGGFRGFAMGGCGEGGMAEEVAGHNVMRCYGVLICGVSLRTCESRIGLVVGVGSVQRSQ